MASDHNGNFPWFCEHQKSLDLFSIVCLLQIAEIPMNSSSLAETLHHSHSHIWKIIVGDDGRIFGLSPVFYLSLAGDTFVLTGTLCSLALNAVAVAVLPCIAILLTTLGLVGLAALSDIKSGAQECLSQEKSESSSPPSPQPTCQPVKGPPSGCIPYVRASSNTIYGLDAYNWYTMGLDGVNDIESCFPSRNLAFTYLYKLVSGYIGIRYNSAQESLTVSWSRNPPGMLSAATALSETIDWVSVEYSSIWDVSLSSYHSMHTSLAAESLLSESWQSSYCVCSDWNQTSSDPSLLASMSFFESASTACTMDMCLLGSGNS